MEPKTKLQKKIVEFSKLIPKINKEQIYWAKEKCHSKCFVTAWTKHHYCLECNHQWKDNNIESKQSKKAICPKCKEQLILAPKYQNGRYSEILYFAIIDTVNEYQVVRMFYSSKHHQKSENPHYFIKEVMQHWIDKSGKKTTLLASCHGMSMYYDNWNFSSKLEIRGVGKNTQNRENLYPSYIHPKMKISKHLKRNGMKNSVHGMNPLFLFQSLLTNNNIESLFKSKLYKLVEYHYRHNHIPLERYWNSIKITIRNNYKVHDVSLWYDYLENLNYFGKDLRNAKYVCPVNLRQEHDKYMAMKNKALGIENPLTLTKRIKRDNHIYQKEKKPYLKLKFIDNDLIIKPFQSVRAIYKEGQNLNHCIFSSNYHKKVNSLLLLAKINNKSVETIEVSLKTFEVSQVRGFNNLPTKNNARIKKLVTNNMHLIINQQKQLEIAS